MYMKKIRNLRQLEKAVDNKKSIFCPNTIVFNKPISAAFMINLIGSLLLKLFRQGMYIYEPKTFTKKSNRKV
jgi:hypothetical protein